MKQFLEREINKLQNEINESLEVLKNENGGVAWFLRHNSKEALQKSWLMEQYQTLYKELDNSTKEEILDYINREIKICTMVLMSGKMIPYSTNPMHNLVEMWEKETYPHYIKALEGMKRMM